MFTGIVEEIGKIFSSNEHHLSITGPLVISDAKAGDSISVNGTCLTITLITEKGFEVDVVPETLRRTNLGKLVVGDEVNLERSMPVNGRFGGHIVQGHVDGTAFIKTIKTEGPALNIEFETPSFILKYVVEKGFIAVDGASLTVVNCGDNSFTVTIIPHTKENTVFRNRKIGDQVNLEIDIFAKYAEKLVG